MMVELVSTVIPHPQNPLLRPFLATPLVDNTVVFGVPLTFRVSRTFLGSSAACRTFWAPFSLGPPENLSGPRDLSGPFGGPWDQFWYLGFSQDLLVVHIFFSNTQEFDKFTNICPVLDYSKRYNFSNCMGPNQVCTLTTHEFHANL